MLNNGLRFSLAVLLNWGGSEGIVASSYLPLLMPLTAPTLNCRASRPYHIIPLTQQYSLGHLAMGLGRSIQVDSHLGGHHSSDTDTVSLLVLYWVLVQYPARRHKGKLAGKHPSTPSAQAAMTLHASSSQLQERSSHLVDYLRTVGYCDLFSEPKAANLWNTGSGTSGSHKRSLQGDSR